MQQFKLRTFNFQTNFILGQKNTWKRLFIYKSILKLGITIIAGKCIPYNPSREVYIV